MSVRSVVAAAAAFVALGAAALPASAASGSTCANAGTEIADLPLDDARAAVLCLVNGERRARGLGALRSERRLRVAAQRFSRDMVSRGYFDHVTPEGATLTERISAAGYPGECLGETLAWAQGADATPAKLVRGWMRSRPHKAILLDDAYRDVGVGLARGVPDGDDRGVTAVLDVGDR